MDNNSVVRLDSSNYKDYIGALREVRSRIEHSYPLGFILKSLQKIMQHYSVVVPDSYSDVVDSLNLMESFLLKGYEDVHRDQLYNQLVMRVYRLVLDLSLNARLKFNDLASYLTIRGDSAFDIGDLREQLEAFVSDTAMLSLEPDDGKVQKSQALYENRQSVISKAFINIIRSGQWNKEQSNDMSSLLLSPTIDIVDAQVLCSALLLATLISPDPYKVLTMVDVYKKATDEKLRQRSLVGWVLALDANDYNSFKDLGDVISQLLVNESVKEDLAELQIQIIYCIGAEKDNETIRKDVMPTIIKNQNLEITRYGIREKDEDPMDDILNGDDTDKRMEEMEKTVRKMADMQKRGVDIYFGGFSKMKRFGFFYTLCNWFMPFYTNHPGLKHLSPNMLNSGFMKALFKNGPFCDSDKYSFALGMSSVYERLPENIREMLTHSEDLHILGDSGADVNAPAYIRRFYLQDLYRFFRISDAKALFKDPFNNKNGHLFMDNLIYTKSLHSEAQRIVPFLIKRKQYVEAENLLKSYKEVQDLKDIFLEAQISMYQHKYSNAASSYDLLFEKGVEDIPTLKGAALTYFYNGSYDKSVKLYQRLAEAYPEKSLYKLNLAISLINDDKAEEGVNVLYELYYKQPDDMDVQRALAWGLLSSKKVDKAKKLYVEILNSTNKSSADYLNAGYCAWFDGDIEKAVTLFRTYLKEDKSASGNIGTKFLEDDKILNAYDISKVNRLLVAGMV